MHTYLYVYTPQGFTPLHVAARCGQLSVLRALLDAGVPVDCVSTPAMTMPLHLAAGFSRVGCVEELLKRGADPLKENSRGVTPFGLVGSLFPVHLPGAPDCTMPSGRHGHANGSSPAPSPRKRGEDGKRVGNALKKACAWQRRRSTVLLCKALRARALECRETARLEERRCGRTKRARGGATEAVRGGRPVGRGAEGAWVVEQLCTHSEPVLMNHVIGFL